MKMFRGIKPLVFFVSVAILLSFVVSIQYVYGLNVSPSSRRDVSVPLWPTAALPTSIVSGNNAAVLFPMGSQNNILNRFWQLFTYDTATKKWQNIISGIGVATNGGLSIVPGQNGQFVLTVFPSVLLRFSPVDILKLSDRTRAAYTYTPLPPMTVNVLHTLSNAAEVTGNTYMSIAGTSRGSHPEIATGSLNGWRNVFLMSSTGSNCRVDNVSSLLYANSVLLFGTDCMAVGDLSHVFYRIGKWAAPEKLSLKEVSLSFKNILPHRYLAYKNMTSDTILLRGLSASFSGKSTAVAGGLVALLNKTGSMPHPVGLYAFTAVPAKNSHGGGIDLLTGRKSFLPLSLGSQVISAGRYTSSGYFVLVKGTGKKTSLFLYKSLRFGWVQVSNPPDGTQTVVQPNNSPLQAFVAAGNLLRVYSHVSRKWILSQSAKIGIQYGSSS